LENKIPLSLLCVGLLLASFRPILNAQTEQRVFVLEIHGRGVLCAYTKESEWAKVPKDQDVEFVAIATSVGDRLKSVLVQNLTSDTTRYDEYTIGGNGDVTQLKRTLLFPDTAEQVWQVRGGKPVKISETWRRFKTNQPIPPDKDFARILKNAPIIMRVSEFPFSGLITDTHPEKWQSGVRCERGSMDKLENPEFRGQ
jgi:hypothetical protein